MKFSFFRRASVDDRRTNTAIGLLIFCATGVLAFTVAGGLLVYRSTQNFLETSKWLEHTHNVLEALQGETARVDRIDTRLQLFQANHAEETLRSATGAIVSMNAGTMRIQELVKDNPSQSAHARELGGVVDALSRAVDPSLRQGVLPEAELRNCRNVLSRMQTEERGLLEERTALSQQALVRPLLGGAAYLGISLVAWIVLFSALIRDALRQRLFERRLSEANGTLATTVDALGDRVREAILLKSARDELQLCVSTEQAYACSARHMQQFLPESSGAILAINNSRTLMVPTAEWNEPGKLAADGFEVQACCGLRTGRPRWRKVGESELHCTHFGGTPPENYLCIPLSALGETLGVAFVSVPNKAVAELAAARLPLLYEMVELAAMAIAGLNLRARLENQSIRDRLTGLFNRHFLEIALEREIQRSTRNGASMAVLMLDVDHFKSFNDRFGHEAGDLILRELAECLRSTVRSEDVVCRYGGEEFVLLLPEITLELALEAAERLRNRVEELRLTYRGETLQQISISVGVSIFPQASRDSGELLRMADVAMYHAKKSGRNQVKMFAQ